MIRKIIEIDQDKCNGCGLCVEACHEGALQLVNGKAKLVSDEYCDGLGDCLPQCPEGAIRIIEREAKDYNEEAVKEKMRQKEARTGTQNLRPACSCPGTMAGEIKRPATPPENAGTTGTTGAADTAERPSELRQWPIQLNLINSQASYLKNADLLIAADCTAYAYASFHEKFMKGRITLIGCPKLDDIDYYVQKITEILQYNEPKSILIARMDVPCCSGIVRAVKEAILRSGVVVPFGVVTINARGEIISQA